MASGSDIVGGDVVVAAYQQQLIALGYLPQGSADGVSGKDTIAAVKAFQKDAGLVVDGVVGDKTRAALVAALAAKQTGGGATSSFVQSSSSSASSPLDQKLLADMLGQASQAFPAGTTVVIPGIGPVTVPGVPGATPGVMVPGVTPGATPGGISPGGASPSGTTPSAPPPPPADKIFGLPKNIAIGGGVALGVLALLGIYMMMSKDKSESRSEGAKRPIQYTDESGQRWVMDEFDNVFPAGFESASLAQRARKHLLPSHPRHRR